MIRGGLILSVVLALAPRYATTDLHRPFEDNVLMSMMGEVPTGRITGVHIIDEDRFITVGTEKTVRFWKKAGESLTEFRSPIRIPAGRAFNGTIWLSAFRRKDNEAYLALIWLGAGFNESRNAPRDQFNLTLLKLKVSDKDITVDRKTAYAKFEPKLIVNDVDVSAVGDVIVATRAEPTGKNKSDHTESTLVFTPSWLDHSLTGRKVQEEGSGVAISPDGQWIAVRSGGSVFKMQSNGEKKTKAFTKSCIALRWSDALYGLSNDGICMQEGSVNRPAAGLTKASLGFFARGDLEDSLKEWSKARGIDADWVEGLTAMDCLGPEGTTAESSNSKLAFGLSSLSRRIGESIYRLRWVSSALQLDRSLGGQSVRLTFDIIQKRVLTESSTVKEGNDYTVCGEGAKGSTFSDQSTLNWSKNEGAVFVGKDKKRVTLRDWPINTDIVLAALSPDRRLAILSDDCVVRIYEVDAATTGSYCDPRYYAYAVPQGLLSAGGHSARSLDVTSPSWFLWDSKLLQAAAGNGGEKLIGFHLNPEGNFGLADWIPYRQAFSNPTVAMARSITDEAPKPVDAFPVEIAGIEGAEIEGSGDSKRYVAANPKEIKLILRSKEFVGLGPGQITIMPALRLGGKDSRVSTVSRTLAEDEFSATLNPTPGSGVYSLSCAVTVGGKKAFTEPVLLQIGANVQSETSLPTYVVSCGNNVFDNLGRLQFAQRDAEAVYAYYNARKGSGPGYRAIEPSTDLTLESLQKKIAEVKEGIKGSEANLIFFVSSHGGFDKNTGKGYLMLRQSDPNRMADTAVEWRTLFDMLADTGARNILVLIDACYSGKALQGLVESQKSAGVGIGETSSQLMAARSQISIITSSTAMQTSGESIIGGNGFFTRALLDLLNGQKVEGSGIDVKAYLENGYLSANTLAQALKLEVPRLIRKEFKIDSLATGPQKSGDLISGYMQDPEGYIANRYFYVAKVH